MNNLSIRPTEEVLTHEQECKCPKCTTPQPPPPQRPQYTPTWSTVKVIDFDMSFSNMILFMIKWAFAAIPAMIIIFAATMFLFAALGMFGIGLGSLIGGPTPTPIK
jgi:hypothetical protein